MEVLRLCFQGQDSGKPSVTAVSGIKIDKEPWMISITDASECKGNGRNVWEISGLWLYTTFYC